MQTEVSSCTGCYSCERKNKHNTILFFSLNTNFKLLTSSCCDQNHTKNPQSLREWFNCHLVEHIISSWRKNTDHHRSTLPSVSFFLVLPPHPQCSGTSWKCCLPLSPPSLSLTQLCVLLSFPSSNTPSLPTSLRTHSELWWCGCLKGLFSALWTPGWLLLCLSATAIEAEWTEEASAAHYHVVKPQTRLTQAGCS